MHIRDHGLVALPLLLVGMPWMALGAVAPDVTWIANELRFRRSRLKRFEWWIEFLPESQIVAYRIAHSFLTIGAAWAVAVTLDGAAAQHFCAGWALHVACDLPTHNGRMTQQPLYPFAWRWPWPM
jgi:hypothetical protein